MSDNVGSKVSFFLVGLGIGALVGILFAPKSGEETREYLAQKAKQAAEAKEKLKAEIAEVKSKYDTKEKRQAATAEAKKKYAETKDRLEKAHAEKCTAVRGDCAALYPDAKLKSRACLVWHGCLR